MPSTTKPASTWRGSTSTATRCGRIPIPATPRIAGHSRETPSSTGPRDGIKHGCATTVNPAATTVSRSWHGSVDPRSIGTTTTGRRPRRAGTSTEATSNGTRSERKRQRVARAGATPFSGACRLDLETLKRPPVTPARGDWIAHEDGRGGDCRTTGRARRRGAPAPRWDGQRGVVGPARAGARRTPEGVLLVPEPGEVRGGAPARRGPLGVPGDTGACGGKPCVAGEGARRAGRRGGGGRPGAGPVPPGPPWGLGGGRGTGPARFHGGAGGRPGAPAPNPPPPGHHGA